MRNKPRILCVDDEAHVLDSFRRLLRKDFDLNTATSGQQGLALIEQNGPFAVVVSDFKMPEMNGVEFLTKAKEIAPYTTRVMLTGQADETTAAKAINDGRIFRFLNKPITSSTFIECLKDSIEQYRLVTSEKEILEQTLKGSIEAMSDILSLSNPLAFSRATRIQQHCCRIGKNLALDDLWQLEVATILSHLGYITIPKETLEKKAQGAPLDPIENQMFADLPTVTNKIIGHIARLGSVLEIINKAIGKEPLHTISIEDSVGVSAAILRTVVAFDELIERGFGKKEAITEIQNNKPRFHQAVIDQLAGLQLTERASATIRISINQIKVGMILAEPVTTEEGLTVAPLGFKINELVRQLLKNLHLQDRIQEFVEIQQELDDA